MKTRLIYTLLCCIMVSFVLTGCAKKESSKATESDKLELPEGKQEVTPKPLEYTKLNLYFLDVGKADAILIQSKNDVILIDTGEEENGPQVVEKLEKLGITKINYMIITHFDKDHVGGAALIMDTFPIDKILVPDYVGFNKAYGKFTKALAKTNQHTTPVGENISFTVNDVKFELLGSKNTSIYEQNKDDNNSSLVTYITHGNNVFLMAGDIQKDRMDEMIQEGVLEATVLKVPHHGEAEDNSKEFLEKVNATYAVITDSKKNPASDSTLDWFGQRNTTVYETRYGEVDCQSDGENVIFTQ